MEARAKRSRNELGIPVGITPKEIAKRNDFLRGYGMVIWYLTPKTIDMFVSEKKKTESQKEFEKELKEKVEAFYERIICHCMTREEFCQFKIQEIMELFGEVIRDWKFCYSIAANGPLRLQLIQKLNILIEFFEFGFYFYSKETNIQRERPKTLFETNIMLSEYEWVSMEVFRNYLKRKDPKFIGNSYPRFFFETILENLVIFRDKLYRMK